MENYVYFKRHHTIMGADSMYSFGTILVWKRYIFGKKNVLHMKYGYC